MLKICAWYRRVEVEVRVIMKEEEKQTPLQRQTGGTHYKNMVIQPAEYAEKNGLSLLEGNVVKYISRWKLKGQPLQDLEKAKHCIDLLIEIHNVK
jgi:hypothetical protein